MSESDRKTLHDAALELYEVSRRLNATAEAHDRMLLKYKLLSQYIDKSFSEAGLTAVPDAEESDVV